LAFIIRIVLNVMKTVVGTTRPVTHCHIPQDLNPQQHCCENLE